MIPTSVNTIKWVKHILLHSHTPVLCYILDTCVGFLVGQTYFTANVPMLAVKYVLMW